LAHFSIVSSHASHAFDWSLQTGRDGQSSAWSVPVLASSAAEDTVVRATCQVRHDSTANWARYTYINYFFGRVPEAGEGGWWWCWAGWQAQSWPARLLTVDPRRVGGLPLDVEYPPTYSEAYFCAHHLVPLFCSDANKSSALTF
jgi:hypothetical protein